MSSGLSQSLWILCLILPAVVHADHLFSDKQSGQVHEKPHENQAAAPHQTETPAQKKATAATEVGLSATAVVTPSPWKHNTKNVVRSRKSPRRVAKLEPEDAASPTITPTGQIQSTTPDEDSKAAAPIDVVRIRQKDRVSRPIKEHQPPVDSREEVVVVRSPKRAKMHHQQRAAPEVLVSSNSIVSRMRSMRVEFLLLLGLVPFALLLSYMLSVVETYMKLSRGVEKAGLITVDKLCVKKEFQIGTGPAPATPRPVVMSEAPVATRQQNQRL